jgi:hypothetical protein
MAGTYYYGLVTPPNDTDLRLVRVWTNSDSGRADCTAAGLISQHDFCWGNLEHYDSYLDFEKHNSKLAPGLMTWYLSRNLSYDHVRWCSKFAARSSMKLVDMALPGSHDSGTSQSENNLIADRYNVTQDWSIINQLILGIRYLDLRCTRSGSGSGSEDGGIWTHHAGYKGEKLNRALTGAKLFLTKYPTEFVLVYLSHEKNIPRAEVESEINSVMGYLSYADSSTTYADAKGKLLVIQEPNLQRNVAPDNGAGEGGEDGFYEWNGKRAWLETIGRTSAKFNLFECQLTGRSSEPGGINSYPVTLAATQYPLFQAWMQTPASDNVGIVSNDWFGPAASVATGISYVIAKNNPRI